MHKLSHTFWISKAGISCSLGLCDLKAFTSPGSERSIPKRQDHEVSRDQVKLKLKDAPTHQLRMRQLSNMDVENSPSEDFYPHGSGKWRCKGLIPTSTSVFCTHLHLYIHTLHAYTYIHGYVQMYIDMQCTYTYTSTYSHPWYIYTCMHEHV